MMDAAPGAPNNLPGSRGRATAVRLTVASLLLVHAALIWLTRPAGIATGGDDARYLLLGQALRHLRYVELWRVDQPIHSLYPPVYPALLGLWGLVAGGGFDAQIVLSVLLSVAALGTAYLIAARHFDRRIALAALAALAVSPSLIVRAGTVASEPAYMLLSLLALLVLSDRRGERWLVVGGTLVVAAGLTRTVGATLIAAVVLSLVLERRFAGAAGLTVAAGLTLGLWLLWSALAPDKFIGGSYVADALATVQQQPRVHSSYAVVLAGRLVHNASDYARIIVESVIPLPTVAGALPVNLLWLGVAGGGLAAGLVAAWRRCRVVALYLLVTAALLLAWPWAIARFLEPVTPLVVPLWLWGLWLLAGRLRPQWRFGVTAGAAVAVVATSLVASVQAVGRRERCGREIKPPGANACLWPAQQDFMAAIRWMRDSTPVGAVTLATKEGDFYYYARRPTVNFRAAINQRPAGFVDYVRGHGVQYVVLTTLTIDERRRLADRLAPNCGALDVAATVAPDAYVLRLKPAGDRSATNACAAVAEFQRAVADSGAGQRWR
jgi:hypothetical protein